MAGLWSRKFDYVNGEQRICKHCSVSFHTIKPRWGCTKCVNAKQKIVETQKRAIKPKKEQYSFNTRTNEAGARFHRIQRDLRKAWKEFEKTGDKSIITQHYDKQIKEIEENGIMKWILDRRDKETAEAKQLKSKSNITKDYPNHHDYYEY